MANRVPGASDRYDLIVVGGGINGAGIARDAAIRGLKVCLLEKEDYGWGTSSRSSHLIHGGLRYLEQFEFGLVHEALQDREILLRHAPHLVRPLRFLYPIYPHIAARRTVRMGLWLYDLLSHGKSLPKRSYLKRKAALAEAPMLNPDGLAGAATYSDAQIVLPERLIQELIWDARQHGADCHNHAHVDGVIIEGGAVAGVQVRLGGEDRVIHADAVVNATGTWVDDLVAGLAPRSLVRKTKGVHLVVPRFMDDALIVKAHDGRTFFVIPWLDHCLVGTTDTDYHGDASAARAEPEDVAYLLDAASWYLPDAPLSDIRYTFAGVRALVNQEGLTESNVTRRHILYHHADHGATGMWSLQGGKITTYRSLAEETVDQVARHLGRKQLAKNHPTRTTPLPGGIDIQDWESWRKAAVRTAQRDGLPKAVAERLVDVYGAKWDQVIACDPQGGRITEGTPHHWSEVVWAVNEEQAQSLADVMLRRTDLGWSGDGRPDAAKRVAQRMQELLDWSDEECQMQVEFYLQQAALLAPP